MSHRQRIMRELMKSRKKLKPQLLEAQKKTKWNIIKGDTVQVIGTHPESGKQGVVLDVNRKKDRVTVEGVNLGPRRIKGDPNGGTKGLRERSMHYSNVNLVDPVTGLPTRVYRKILDDGTKVRVAKKSGAVIAKPDIPLLRKKPISPTVTESDTLDADAWEVTYVPEESMMLEEDGSESSPSP